MYLQKENLAPAVSFVTGGLWADFKRALNDRRPKSPETNAMPSEASQQFFLRRGFELAMEEMEKVARDVNPAFEPPKISPIHDTRD